MTLDTGHLREILFRGEDETTAFTLHLRSARQTAKTLAAFANARGGHLLVGVNFSGQVVGADPAQTERIVRAATDRLKPRPQVDVYGLSVGASTVVVVDVTASPELVVSDDGVYQRVGEKTAPMSASALASALGTSGLTTSENVARLSDLVSQLTGKIEGLETRVAEANRPMAKWKDYIVGGVIGAALGVVPNLLL